MNGPLTSTDGNLMGPPNESNLMGTDGNLMGINNNVNNDDLISYNDNVIVSNGHSFVRKNALGSWFSTTSSF